MEDVAHLFFNNVVKDFGLPTKIISDRDTKFTSQFWKMLFQKSSTKLAISTADHPQADGQSEN